VLVTQLANGFLRIQTSQLPAHDDAHHLRNRRRWNVCRFCSRQCRPTSSDRRHAPDLEFPWARRALGQVLELRADDLRFLPLRPRSFWSSKGTRISPPSIFVTFRNAAGWIVGLKLFEHVAACRCEPFNCSRCNRRAPPDSGLLLRRRRFAANTRAAGISAAHLGTRAFCRSCATADRQSNSRRLLMSASTRGCSSYRWIKHAPGTDITPCSQNTWQILQTRCRGSAGNCACSRRLDGGSGHHVEGLEYAMLWQLTRYGGRDTRGELRFDVASGPAGDVQRLPPVSHPSTALHPRIMLASACACACNGRCRSAQSRGSQQDSRGGAGVSGRIDASEIKRLNFLVSASRRSTRARTYQINALEVNCTALAGI